MADDLGFTYKTSKKGEVFIYRQGKLALTLRSKSAVQFLTDVEYLSFDDTQQKIGMDGKASKKGQTNRFRSEGEEQEAHSVFHPDPEF